MILVTVGGGLLNYHYTVTGCAIFLAALVAIVLDIHVYYRYKFRGRRTILWWPFVIFVICQAFILISAAIASILIPEPPTYRILSASRIIKRGTGLGPFVVSDGKLMYSVDDLVFVTLVNKLSTQRNIRGYQLEMMDKHGKSTGTCHLDLRHINLYFILLDGSGAIQIETDKLDSALASGIPPEGKVSGWSAWQCVNIACPDNATMRFHIEDLLGRIENVPIPERIDALTPDQFLEQALMRVQNKVPVSSLGIPTSCQVRH